MVYAKTRSTLQSRGLAPQKKLGQNFLIHRHTAERIVDLADPGPEDVIVEVGVGLGALTNLIAARADRVIGLETDAGLVRWHEEEKDLAANVTLLHQDILRVDPAGLADMSGGPLKIIANLPYSISTPFLFRMIDNRSLMDWAVIMLQKEVAQRLLARPGTREYGVPTVLLAGCAAVEPLLRVKPAEFHPRPKVDSMVVRLRFRPPPIHEDLPSFDWELLKQIVNSCFSRRRKTLLNGLSAAGLGLDRDRLALIIRRAGLDPVVRAEQLSFSQFVRLAHFAEAGGQSTEDR
jgi:16S rRNA (adenine1518-N6/adenine1519-N6)-dimethyltransferase